MVDISEFLTIRGKDFKGNLRLTPRFQDPVNMLGNWGLSDLVAICHLMGERDLRFCECAAEGDGGSGRTYPEADSERILGFEDADSARKSTGVLACFPLNGPFIRQLITHGQ